MMIIRNILMRNITKNTKKKHIRKNTKKNIRKNTKKNIMKNVT